MSSRSYIRDGSSFSIGADGIEVSTQETNLPAYKLYESLGYQLDEKVYVYHWWKTPNRLENRDNKQI